MILFDCLVPTSVTSVSVIDVYKSIDKYIRESCFVKLHCKTMSVLLLATIFLLCVSEVISNCPPDSGKQIDV